MSESSGRLAGRMKWLVARYPKVSGKLITLGSILTDREEPETRLNRDHIVPIDPDDIFDESLAVSRKVVAELSKESNVLLKAVPPEIFGPGVSVDGKLTAGVTTTVEAMNVQAQVFLPRHPEEYMNASLANVEVQNWVRKHLFTKSLYLIVGVATANKLSIKENQFRNTEISGTGGIAPPGTDTDLTVGFRHENASTTNSELDIRGKCDFAYRVREFKVWRFKKETKDIGDSSSGALFGMRDGESDDSDDEDAFVPRFHSFSDEDCSPKKGDSVAFDVGPAEQI
jgi:hypothetical protein